MDVVSILSASHFGAYLSTVELKTQWEVEQVMHVIWYWGQCNTVSTHHKLWQSPLHDEPPSLILTMTDNLILSNNMYWLSGYAAEKGWTRTVRWIMDNYSDNFICTHMLQAAFLHGQKKIVQMLLPNDDAKNPADPVLSMFETGDAAFICWALDEYDWVLSPIYICIAINAGHLDTLKILHARDPQAFDTKNYADLTRHAIWSNANLETFQWLYNVLNLATYPHLLANVIDDAEGPIAEKIAWLIQKGHTLDPSREMFSFECFDAMRLCVEKLHVRVFPSIPADFLAPYRVDEDMKWFGWLREHTNMEFQIFSRAVVSNDIRVLHALKAAGYTFRDHTYAPASAIGTTACFAFCENEGMIMVEHCSMDMLLFDDTSVEALQWLWDRRMIDLSEDDLATVLCASHLKTTKVLQWMQTQQPSLFVPASIPESTSARMLAMINHTPDWRFEDSALAFSLARQMHKPFDTHHFFPAIDMDAVSLFQAMLDNIHVFGIPPDFTRFLLRACKVNAYHILKWLSAAISQKTSDIGWKRLTCSAARRCGCTDLLHRKKN